MIRLFAAALCALLCAGITLAQASGEASERILRADGSEIVFHLANVRGDEPRGALILFQGSGCNPVGDSEALARSAPVLGPEMVAVTIEKYGVDPEAEPELEEGCTADFWRKATVQQRVLDGARVVAALRDEPWWNGELVIFGGSEGGAVAAMLAPLLPETDAVVVYSSGIGMRVEEMIRAVIPPEGQEESARIWADARENPTGTRRWGGASYRWWADSLDLVPARALIGSDFPVLLVHGDRDQFAPVMTAHAAVALWDANDREHVTYREYPGYDHFMTDENGRSHDGEVMAEIAAWIGAVTAN